MKIFSFSGEFVNTVVLPMVTLFLGTGNATPEVLTIVLWMLQALRGLLVEVSRLGWVLGTGDTCIDTSTRTSRRQGVFMS
jgi:hypothetical protein